MTLFRIAAFLGVLVVCSSAFALQMPRSMPGDRDQPSAFFVPVFTAGGGPSDSGVLKYKIEIGDCKAKDEKGKYKVTTCKGGNPDIIEQNHASAQTYVVALMEMAAQFSSVMLQQMHILGTFFDAKEHLETQRDLSVLTARAHKDYHPSQLMCQFGSGIRSIATAEERARYSRQAADLMMVDYYKNAMNSAASKGFDNDMKIRIDEFKKTYCDPRDHNNQLWELCYGQSYNSNNPPSLPASANPARFNKDIDYNLSFSDPMTLKVDFTDPQVTDTEKDLIAMARHLYWPEAFNPANRFHPSTKDYQDARSLMARISLAHNSFLHIVGMKSESPKPATDNMNGRRGSDYLRAVLRLFGDFDDTKIAEFYGDNPSYFAQMEILTKKLYQHPQFYTNLYDKPANIDRVNATLEALQLMQMRDRYDSQTRREMLSALLLVDGMQKEVDRVGALVEKPYPTTSPANPQP